jgi:hypothetical protein
MRFSRIAAAFWRETLIDAAICTSVPMGLALVD